MNYTTSIPVQPAVTLSGLMEPPSFVNRDAYDGLAGGIQNNLDRQAQMLNAQHMQKAASAQSQAALQGALQMSRWRQNAQNLATARQSAALSFMNDALRGLYP